MSADHGTDVALVLGANGTWDMGKRLGLVSGRMNLAHAIARRFTTPQGKLTRHPAYGRDMRALRGRSFSAADLIAEQAAFAAQCTQDPRVVRAAVRLELHAATRALTLRVGLEDADGPFELVFLLSAAGAVQLIVKGAT